MLSYFNDHRSEIMSYLGWHIRLSVIPVILGLLIAVPLGWVARRYRWTYAPLISIAGLIYTIPSIVLFVLLPGILQRKILDPINVIVALTLYTVALLVRVVADGLANVSDDTRQAATAMGYKPIQRFFKVELPIAIPVIAAGVRVAVVSNVSLTAVAATIGVPQLGFLFTEGFNAGQYPERPIIIGIVLCVLLALVLDLIVQLITRFLTPWRRAVRPA